MLQKNTDAALLFRQQNQRRSAETEQLQLHHQLQKVNSPSPKLSVPENQVAVAGGRPLDVLPDDQHQVPTSVLHSLPSDLCSINVAADWSRLVLHKSFE